MSSKSNTLSRTTPRSPSLKPKIYQDKFDDKFCTTFFKNHPDYLDLRSPKEKLKCLNEILETEDLEPGERFVVLSQMVVLQDFIHGGKSVENLRAEAELGFFYNENLSPVQALKHLDKAHSLEKKNQIEVEESIKIAVEIAKAHLLLRKSGKDHLKQANSILKPYFYTEISDIQLRFDRDLARSRILAAQRKYDLALESYEDARLTLREIYDDNDSQPEAELYLEMAQMLEKARIIPDHREKAAECYMKAHQIYMNIGNEEEADKIDLHKLPEDYRIEVMKRKGIYKDYLNDYDVQYSTDTNTEYESDTIYDIEYETDFEYEVEIENIEPNSEFDLDKASLNSGKNSQNGNTDNNNETENQNDAQSQNGEANQENASQNGETNQQNEGQNEN